MGVPTADGPGAMAADEWERHVSRLTADRAVTLEPRDVAALLPAPCPRCLEKEAAVAELETRLRQFDPVTDARLRAEGR